MTNEMTAEEAIQELELKKKAHLIQGNTRMVELCDLCIKAIKTKPCEDAISRSDLLQKIQEAPTHLNETWDELYDSVIDDINSMPSVKPERPKGRWIGHGEHCENLGVMPTGLGAYEWCSNCDCGIDVREWHRNHYNFCPNCGADMRGENNGNMD